VAKKPEVRFTVSAQMITYLEWLKANTILGDSTNEIAKQVLTDRLSEMRGENFHDKPADKAG
jgi:hypothetical protein